MDWLDNPVFDSPRQTLSNFFAGFGDGLSFGITNLIREGLDLNSQVDKCSGLYNAGWYGGFLYGLALPGVGSLNAGARSVFYSGEGALKAAQLGKGSAQILADTVGGKVLNAINANVIRLPDFVWNAASAIFSANAKGTAQVFLRGEISNASVWIRVERPILTWLRNATIVTR